LAGKSLILLALEKNFSHAGRVNQASLVLFMIPGLTPDKNYKYFQMIRSLVAKFPVITMLILAVALVSSCKDDDPAPSKEPLLTGKSWIVVKTEMDGQDVTDELEACEIDNTTTFFSDGTFIEDTGELTCEEFETDVDGTWVFKANETIISLRPSGETASDWKILELTDETFRISQYVQLLEAEVVVEMATK
jgi:hypothetical protein